MEEACEVGLSNSHVQFMRALLPVSVLEPDWSMKRNSTQKRQKDVKNQYKSRLLHGGGSARKLSLSTSPEKIFCVKQTKRCNFSAISLTSGACKK